MANSVVFTTVTEFTTLLTLPENIVPPSSAATSTLSSKFTSSASTTSPSSIHPPPNIPHPSGWPHHTNSPGLLSPAVLTGSNTLANIVLAAVILLVVLYLSVFGLAIVTWWKGRCPNCAALENKFRRMEQGRMVDVMGDVQERETIRAHRASALANLETNTGRVKSGDLSYRHTAWPIWKRFFEMTAPTKKGKGKVPAGTPTLPNDGFRGRSSLHHLDAPAPPMPAYNPYFRASRNPSMYSRTSEDWTNPNIGQPFDLKDQKNNEGEVFYNNRREVISHFEPYNGAPAPYCRVSWEKPEIKLPKIAEKESNSAQIDIADQGAGEAQSLAFGMQPYIIESVPLDDPDTEKYCNAASLAADLLNPDREDASKYADRILRDIRMRERNKLENEGLVVENRA